MPMRVPASRVDYPALRPYFPGGAATLKEVGRFVLLENAPVLGLTRFLLLEVRVVFLLPRLGVLLHHFRLVE